ncbi:hypothetical protein ACVWZX_004700 [Deinococcus sp. UYEF24]
MSEMPALLTCCYLGLSLTSAIRQLGWEARGNGPLNRAEGRVLITRLVSLYVQHTLCFTLFRSLFGRLLRRRTPRRRSRRKQKSRAARSRTSVRRAYVSSVKPSRRRNTRLSAGK